MSSAPQFSGSWHTAHRNSNPRFKEALFLWQWLKQSATYNQKKKNPPKHFSKTVFPEEEKNIPCAEA